MNNIEGLVWVAVWALTSAWEKIKENMGLVAVGIVFILLCGTLIKVGTGVKK